MFSGNVDFVAELLVAHTRLKALGESTEYLAEEFWTTFERSTQLAYAKFPSEFSPKPFSVLIQTLCRYQKALDILSFPGEHERIVSVAKHLVLLFAVLVLEQKERKSLSPNDSFILLGAMMLGSTDSIFCLHFGELKLLLESRYFSSGIRAFEKTCHYCMVPTSPG